MSSLASLIEAVSLRYVMTAIVPACVLVGGFSLNEAIVLALRGRPDQAAAWLDYSFSGVSALWFWTSAVLVSLALVILNRLIVQTWEGYPWLNTQRFLARLFRRTANSTNSIAEWKAKARGAAPDDVAALNAWITTHKSSDVPPETLRLTIGTQWREANLPVPRAHPLPTRLGRTLSRMETAPVVRYGLDSIELWPRMYLVAPAGLLSQYSQAKTWVDFDLNLATVFAGLGVHVTARHGLGLPAVLLAIMYVLMALLCYRAALPMADLMRKTFETTFDLYRGELLKAWGLKQPRAVLDEHRVWRGLGDFLRWGDPRLFPEEFRERSRRSDS